MDPNTNLANQLDHANNLLHASRDMDPDHLSTIEQDALRLAELVVALNRWIAKGGFLPKGWIRATKNPPLDCLKDKEALDKIRNLMSGEEWNADLWEPISEIVMATGRELLDPGDSLADKPTPAAVAGMRWKVWQLAEDRATYGDDAGKHIVTTEDGEHEVTGVLPWEIASLVVQTHNAHLAAIPAAKKPLSVNPQTKRKTRKK